MKTDDELTPGTASMHRRGAMASSAGKDLDPSMRGSLALATVASEAYDKGASAEKEAREAAMAAFAAERSLEVRGKLERSVHLDPYDTSAFGLLAKLREGHGLGVYACVWADDCRHIASCSHDGSVLVWDIAKLEVKRAYRGHTGPVYSVVFSPLGDNDRLATASADCSVRLWTKRSGKQLFSFHELRCPVLTVAFCHDGSLLATAGESGAIVIYSIERVEADLLRREQGRRGGGGEEEEEREDDGSGSGGITSSEAVMLTLDAYPDIGEGHAGPVRRVAWSKDDAYLASGGDDRVVKVWSLAGGGLLHKDLVGHTGAVHDVSFSPDAKGARLASASADGSVRLWNWRQGTALRVLNGVHLGVVYCVAWLPGSGGRRLISGGHDRSVVVWDGDSGRSLQLLPGIHASWVLGISVRADGLHFATASGDRTVGLWRALPPSWTERIKRFAYGITRAILSECATITEERAEGLLAAGGKHRGQTDMAAGGDEGGAKKSAAGTLGGDAAKARAVAAAVVAGGGGGVFQAPLSRGRASRVEGRMGEDEQAVVVEEGR